MIGSFYFTGMHYVVYVLGNARDSSWYIGFTTNLKERVKAHNSKRSPYTSTRNDWKLIYAELYLNKADALGREKFLKSGAGHRFLKKQLAHYLSE